LSEPNNDLGIFKGNPRTQEGERTKLLSKTKQTKGGRKQRIKRCKKHGRFFFFLYGAGD
jgi:hypothetical protein